MSETADPEWVLQEQFQFLTPFLIGTPRQFAVWQGQVVCLRADPRDPLRKNPEINPCETCPHFGACELGDEIDMEATHKLPDNSISGIEPHSRRGVGLEDRPFLVLRFQTGQSHATMPVELWDSPWADKAMYEANLHHALVNPRTTTFHTIKGQVRYYGSEENFLASPYAHYLDVVDVYEPLHRPISLDFSAIEPRVSTLCAREPEWMRVFKGTPKVISREVQFASSPDRLPSYIHESTGRTYCFLADEMDKLDYSEQCGRCALSNLCRPVQDHFKNVAGDWHGINADGLYGDEFTKNPDKYFKKELRAIAKIVGLALTYGGSAWTVAGNMKTTQEQAQARIDAFFAKLVVLSRYMLRTRSEVLATGWVRNLFNRLRDMRAWVNSQAMDPTGRYPDSKKRRQHRAFAERTALNYPIQSTASEILKLAMIRVDELIQKHQWNPLSGLGIPQRLTVGRHAYRGLIFALLSSVHDELLYLVQDGHMHDVIPQTYEVMQLADIMAEFRTGFSLELDCEYDETRSWTASKKLQTSHIYLLNRLSQQKITSGDLSPKQPNLAVLDWELCTPEVLSAYTSNDNETQDADAACMFGVMVRDRLYLYNKVLPRDFIERAAQRCGVPVRFGFL